MTQVAIQPKALQKVIVRPNGQVVRVTVAYSAGTLQSMVDAAEAAKVAAQTAVTAAQLAETNAETAETNAEAAQVAAAGSATAAAGSATTAGNHAADADADRIAAENAKSAAETARDAAQTAKTAAETARDAAQTAETNAETAETNAEAARDAAIAAKNDAEAAAASTDHSFANLTGAPADNAALDAALDSKSKLAGGNTFTGQQILDQGNVTNQPALVVNNQGAGWTGIQFNRASGGSLAVGDQPGSSWSIYATNRALEFTVDNAGMDAAPQAYIFLNKQAPARHNMVLKQHTAGMTGDFLRGVDSADAAKFRIKADGSADFSLLNLKATGPSVWAPIGFYNSAGTWVGQIWGGGPDNTMTFDSPTFVFESLAASPYLTLGASGAAFTANVDVAGDVDILGSLTVGGVNVGTALAGKVNSSLINQPNGIAGLDSSGMLPVGIIPGMFNDVLEYDNAAALPATGAAGVLYVTKDNNHIYRWTGSAYSDMTAAGSGGPTSTDGLIEGSVNKYYTDVRVRAAPLTGFSSASGGAIVATDTVLQAFGKAQNSIDTLASALSGKANSTHSHATSDVSGLDTALAGKVSKAGDTLSGGLTLPSITVSGVNGSVMFADRDGTGTFHVYNYGDALRVYNGAQDVFSITSTGQVRASSNIGVDVADNQLLMKTAGTSKTVIHRVDGSDYYVLLSSAAAALNGTWDALRPLVIQMTDGRLRSENGQTFIGGTTIHAPTGSAALSLTKDGSNTASIFNDGNLHVRGPVNWYDASGHYWMNEASSLQMMHLGLDGGVPKLTVAGDIVSSSDRRLKKHIAYKIKFGLDEVNQLQPVTYRRKGQDKRAEKEIGLIAQDVEEIFPELVTADHNGMKAVNYQKLSVVLLQAVKELTARLEVLEAR